MGPVFGTLFERTLIEAHYVQAIVTPIGARVEAVGGPYLEAVGHELTSEQVNRLLAAGWHPPADPADTPWGEARLPAQLVAGTHRAGHLHKTVDLLLAALIEIYGLYEQEPILFTLFP
jgi:hypothetical protein